MQFRATQEQINKIELLSYKISYLAKKENSYSNYIDQDIKSENLKHNLSLTLANIIIHLKFTERSVSAFEILISEYNKENGTSLSLTDFQNIYWLRTIGSEIFIPRLISQLIWRLEYYSGKQKQIDIPLGREHLVGALRKYYKKFLKDAQPTISQFDLESIIGGSKRVDINYLIENGILSQVPEYQGSYYWIGGEYTRHLSGEIASTLWLIIGGENASSGEFVRYVKLLVNADISPASNLNHYLNYKNTNKLKELAIAFLKSEADLTLSKNEFTKIWLDAHTPNDIDVNKEIPSIKLNFENTLEFIESINHFERVFPDIFNYPPSRIYYSIPLRIILDFDSTKPTPYQSTLEILKDISRPSLVWMLYEEIRNNYPKVIPYLLNDSVLSPISFRLLDEIEISDKVISTQSNNDESCKEACEIKNELFIEMWDLILDNVESSAITDDKHGELIAKILLHTSRAVFTNRLGTSRDIIFHNSTKSRYNVLLKKIANKRVSYTNIYPKPTIYPRLILFIAPTIINCLIKRIKLKPFHINEILTLNLSLIDLCIEFLKLVKLPSSENEVSVANTLEIEIASKNLIQQLKIQIDDFYGQTEIELTSYWKPNSQKGKAKRGVGNFGFEIIDWGYLYLSFHRYKLLSSYIQTFENTLNFNKDKGIYEDVNKEQYEKLRLFIKSLLLAYISINQKKDFYEIHGFTVNKGIAFLEQKICKFCLKYSIDDPFSKRIDVFNERFSSYSYDIYNNQFLASLLFQSSNFFSNSNQLKLFGNFFSKSLDLGRMLSAINILESKKLREIVSAKINEIDIDNFVNSTYGGQLQSPLIDAVNSDSHWAIAKPLFRKMQEYVKKTHPFSEHIIDLLFEVNLALIFKEKDYNRLKEIIVPKSRYHGSENTYGHNTKKFYLALFELYENKNYSKAIAELRSLLSNDQQNVRYAYQLFRAETLKAIEK